MIRDPPWLRYGACGRAAGCPVVPPGLLRLDGRPALKTARYCPNVPRATGTWVPAGSRSPKSKPKPKPRLGRASQSTWQGMARPHMAWHKAEWVAQFVAPRRPACAADVWPFRSAGRRPGQAGRPFFPWYVLQLVDIQHWFSKGCTMVRGGRSKRNRKLPWGLAHRVKVGHTRSNRFLISKTGKTKANIGDLRNLHFLQILL